MATFLGAVEESSIQRANRLHKELLTELKAINDKKSLYAWKKKFYASIRYITMEQLFDLKEKGKKEMLSYRFKFQKFL